MDVWKSDMPPLTVLVCFFCRVKGEMLPILSDILVHDGAASAAATVPLCFVCLFCLRCPVVGARPLGLGLAERAHS